MAAALLCVAACNSSNDVTAPPAGGSGTSNLVVSAANPADGNSTLTDAATLTVNSGGSGFDELDLSTSVGGVGHEVVVTWDTGTHAINSAQHVWGSGAVTSGFTQCVAGSSPCDLGKIALDFAGHKVTFTGLPLLDAFGGSTSCTLTGTMAW
jgi:hypothetical protein